MEPKLQLYPLIIYLLAALKESPIYLIAKKLVNWIPNVKVSPTFKSAKPAFSIMDLPDKLYPLESELDFLESEVPPNSVPMIVCVGKKLFRMWMPTTKNILYFHLDTKTKILKVN